MDRKKRALVILDFQKDFTTKGKFPISGIDDVEKNIKSILRTYKDIFELVIITKKWHYPNATFFETFDIPKHTLRVYDDNTPFRGSNEIIPILEGEKTTRYNIDYNDVVGYFRGTDKDSIQGGFSLFRENITGKDNNIVTILKAEEIEELYFTGVSFNNSLYNSVYESDKLGFTPFTIKDSYLICPLEPFGKSHLPTNNNEEKEELLKICEEIDYTEFLLSSLV